jgi:ABC-2 type transport system ATP-binding protein
MNALQARGIRKSFRRRQVLAGLDMDVPAGKLIAIVGENGAGKSTLLRILAGDLRPDAGSVRLRGRLGYCPQQVVLDNALTPDQHLRFFQAAYRLSSLDRADELVECLHYGQYRNQPIGTLSGGTRQKVNLTLGLMHSPSLLLLDEPYQGFDWETYLAFWRLAGELRASGTAIVVISHLVYERDRFDAVHQLHEGRLHQGVANDASSV